MLDFSKINPFDQGQRYSFEELVCQLGRKENVPHGSLYRRVEGAGGDGGVEAYWIKPDGKKIAYQAKYFLKSGDIKWNQLDESVKQAISSHPELESYIIALPCDLTDRAGQLRQGQTGWMHWDSNVKRWQKLVEEAGMGCVEFIPWTKSDLTSKLVHTANEGLREFFFGDHQLTLRWFSSAVDSAVMALDERFHPEDHVNVRIEKLPLILARSNIIQIELFDSLSKIKKWIYPESDINKLPEIPDYEILRELQNAHQSLCDLEIQFSYDLLHSWKIDVWYSATKRLLDSISVLQYLRRTYDGVRANERIDRNSLFHLDKNLTNLEESVYSFQNLINSKYMHAEPSKSVFIRGAAGTGKSHLLAKCALNAIENRIPAVLLLGQHFNNDNFWGQICSGLCLDIKSSDQLLGLLNSAGQAYGCRTLLLIDAINEGVGSQYWRDRIPELLSKISKYSHVCCIISCREEYFDLAVPENIKKTHKIFDVKGFSTAEEQLNAARVYLDKRGIARPSTPWLSPEFINPLFLRSVCVALEADGKSELPSGLNGTSKILTYYLNSVAKNIQYKEGIAYSISANLGRAAEKLSGMMLERRVDYLDIDASRICISSEFSSIHPRTESDWLSLLLNYGLLRKDPNPVHHDTFSDPDVIRFSFQRFQDFLMAMRVVNQCQKVEGIFDVDGDLEFCIKNKNIAWEWHGLISALAVALPEKYQTELIDALPGSPERWLDNYYVELAFVESVKWRARNTFTDRTLTLLHQITSQSTGVLDVLIQVSVSADHPWNANFLHKNLVKMNLPERDEKWTTWINQQEDDAESSIGVLLEWCLVGQAKQTNPENQILAAFLLSWLLTSTNRVLRDRATKALTNILVLNSSIFPVLLKEFIKVDDLYVLERLIAAAYASCCLDPQTNRLKIYAEETFRHLFSNGSPPYGLLLRDYALGIVELASHKLGPIKNIDIETCRPPFKSPKVKLSVTSEQLDEIAKLAGGDQIKESVAGHFGDFASYEITYRTELFLNIPLSKNVPLSSEQKEEEFVKDVISLSVARELAYEELKSIAEAERYRVLYSDNGFEETVPTPEQLQQWKQDLSVAEASLFKLLSPIEIKRFRTDADPVIHGRVIYPKNDRKFDTRAIQHWIAKRAYDYGWTHKRFGRERSSSSSYTRDRPVIERIGKKYQWMALDELLSRLADNYWMKRDFSDVPSKYTGPLDIGFHRDVEPTIIRARETHELVSKDENTWAFEPQILLDCVDENELTKWPFRQNPANDLAKLPIRLDADGYQWIVLYEHQSQTDKYENRIGEHGLRIQEFRFVRSCMVLKKDLESIIKNEETKQKIDISQWKLSEWSDEVFLFETGWRDNWDKHKWVSDSWLMPKGVSCSPLLAEFHWESHIDASLPEGYSTYLPRQWVIKELKLELDKKTDGQWLNESGEIIFRTLKGEDGGVVSMLRSDQVNKLLQGDYMLVFAFIAERNAWPGGSNSFACWRRSEGICWFEGEQPKTISWYRDTDKSKSKDASG